MTQVYTRTDEHLLDIQVVGLTLGGNIILRDVNATIVDVERPNLTQGQVVCFLGPSGIGKTQLSKIIAGFVKPTTGQVLLKGVPTSPGRVCVVPQFYPMFDYLTVKGNLELAGKQAGLGVAALADKCNGLSDKLGIAEHWNKYPSELSGGTKQRVAIARQLMCATNYMVMDEPFSGLDPIMKKKAGDTIIQLASLDTYNTIIIVTHDIKQGLKCADMVWLMGLERGNDGKFVAGAKIVESYDLAAMGLSWEPEVDRKPEFMDLVHHIEDRFETLK